MAAASLGLAQNVQVLIDAGEDVSSKDERGFTPFMWATVSGYPRVDGILLANGAEVNAKTCEGLTARELSQRINTGLKNRSSTSKRFEKGEKFSYGRKVREGGRGEDH